MQSRKAGWLLVMTLAGLIGCGAIEAQKAPASQKAQKAPNREPISVLQVPPQAPNRELISVLQVTPVGDGFDVGALECDNDNYDYRGSARLGKPHGAGELKCPNGLEYRGGWHEGKPHGGGELQCPNGLEYSGGWHKGKPHGGGVLRWDGQQYAGGWHHGLLYGQGFKAPLIGNSDSVSSFFFGDDLSLSCYDPPSDLVPSAGDGFGALWCDNREYSGGWHEGKPHGAGALKCPNGLEYSGGFRYGQPHGAGALKCPNGLEYSGGFRYGQPHGGGALKWGRLKYSGEWRDGEPSEVGGLRKPNGERPALSCYDAP